MFWQTEQFHPYTHFLGSFYDFDLQGLSAHIKKERIVTVSMIFESLKLNPFHHIIST